MYQGQNIAVIIPALNEEASIGRVLGDLPECIDRVIVVDNGSSDNTVTIARNAGAEVVSEPERGYGAACLRGISTLDDRVDIILFIDADYSDFPEEAETLLEPIALRSYDLVIGSRMQNWESRRHLTPVARFGNRLATSLINLFWGYHFTDLGPFRAVSHDALKRLNMADRNLGWTVEMQIKAARMGLRVIEQPVSYRQRIGHSKISGTITGSIKAGVKILYLIAREVVRP